ncbi:MAG: hypothetical protein H6R14_1765 [Proteobacteria bacterium]|nr:hypothetical protein [Pseudomonadota bacterium]
MIRYAANLVRGYTTLVRQLPQATGMMFAARSTWGRSFKIGLFGVGVVLPLGSLIWLMLFWHGTGLDRKSLPDKAQRALPPP